MIRRDATINGSAVWLLIKQTEHARVAGELAEHWGAAPFLPLNPRDVILPTVYRHDDGWTAWEEQPQVDPATGRPQSFTEMPAEVAHAIWRRSIESVADLGPLAQYMVAQHFMRLRRGGDEADQPSVKAFLEEFDRRCSDWLTAWQAEDPVRNTREAAQRAVDQLQTFDALSLALCCAQCIGTTSIPTALGPEISLSPAEEGIAARPWPWTVANLNISARACFVPAQPLDSDEQLRQGIVDAERIELFWRLGA